MCFFAQTVKQHCDRKKEKDRAYIQNIFPLKKPLKHCCKRIGAGICSDVKYNAVKNVPAFQIYISDYHTNNDKIKNSWNVTAEMHDHPCKGNNDN